MKKYILSILCVLLLCGQAWGATMYVDPGGSNTSPYDTWAKAAQDLGTATAAVSGDGDIIILKNVTTHTFNPGTQSIQYSFTIRNEDNDTDYSKAEVDFTNNKAIRLAANDKTMTLKGFTVKSVAYTGFPHATVAFEVGDVGQTLNLQGIRWTGVDCTGGTSKGGIISADAGAAGSTINITDCMIEDCDGTLANGVGATIGKITDCDVNITNTTIQNNGDLANGYAGHFYINSTQRACSISIDNVTGTNNATAYDPGAGYDGDGGVFYLYSNNDTLYVTATISNSTFTSNSANKGGAIHVGKDVRATFKNCWFETNHAYDFGGGALCKGSSAVDTDDAFLKVRNSVFLTNTSDSYGGAIFASNGRYYEAINCSFIDNTATTEGDTAYAADHEATGTAKRSLIQNCIIRGTPNNNHICGAGNDGFDTITYNNVEGDTAAISDTGATISNITSGDPYFVSATDFNLQSKSPCINAGIDPFSDGDGDQYDMKDRLVWSDGPNSADSPVGPWGDGVDIGAYGDNTGPAIGM